MDEKPVSAGGWTWLPSRTLRLSTKTGGPKPESFCGHLHVLMLSHAQLSYRMTGVQMVQRSSAPCKPVYIHSFN